MLAYVPLKIACHVVTKLDLVYRLERLKPAGQGSAGFFISKFFSFFVYRTGFVSDSRLRGTIASNSFYLLKDAN